MMSLRLGGTASFEEKPSATLPSFVGLSRFVSRGGGFLNDGKAKTVTSDLSSVVDYWTFYWSYYFFETAYNSLRNDSPLDLNSSFSVIGSDSRLTNFCSFSAFFSASDF